MVWGWIERNRREAGEWTGFLEQGVRLEGKLEAHGTVRIDSEMKGTIVSRDTLILGEHAVVEGEVEGNVVLIAGRFSGKIQASTRVEIQSSAIVTGDVDTPCLMIDPGGVFEGQCLMPIRASDALSLTIPMRSISTASEV